MRIYHPAILALITILGACRSYEAPIADQGDRQVVTPPLIVTASTPDTRLRVPNIAPVIVNSDGSTIRVSQSRRPAEVSISEPVRRTGGRIDAREIPASRTNIHRVSDGDSLYSIAFQYDVDVRALALANGLRSPYTIFVGQELSLDLNAPAANAETRSIAIGMPVRNNGVAQAQAATPARGGVLRDSIGAGTQPISWRWPAESTRLLRSFGTGDARGIDIGVRNGDSVLAAADGEVVYSGRGVQGSGDLIILRHNDRYLSAYAHNSVMLVSEGARVKAGDKIAEAGTNLLGDPLLHFEIREDGKSIDPVGLLPRR